MTLRSGRSVCCVSVRLTSRERSSSASRHRCAQGVSPKLWGRRLSSPLDSDHAECCVRSTKKSYIHNSMLGLDGLTGVTRTVVFGALFTTASLNAAWLFRWASLTSAASAVHPSSLSPRPAKPASESTTHGTVADSILVMCRAAAAFWKLKSAN